MFRKAILLVHGFAGGTYDLEYIQNNLSLNKRFDVYSYTLPGHERILSKVKYTEWLRKSEEMVEFLINNGYREIYVIGHSMGGVITGYLASKYKQIKKIVLAAPAFHYLSVVKDDINFKDSFKASTKVLKAYPSDDIIDRVLKLNVGATREFMKLVSECYNVPSNINCSILILQGDKDNLVPISSSEYVYDNVKSKDKKMFIISGVNHRIFDNKRKDEIYNIVLKFLKNKIKSGIYKI